MVTYKPTERDGEPEKCLKRLDMFRSGQRAARVHVSPDGTKMFVTGTSNDRLQRYDLAVPFAVASGVAAQVSRAWTARDTFVEGFSMTADGTRLYTVGFETDTIHQYEMTTPWDPTTLVYTGMSLDTYHGNAGVGDRFQTTLRDVDFSADGTGMFVQGAGRDASDDLIELILDEAQDALRTYVTEDDKMVFEAPAHIVTARA